MNALWLSYLFPAYASIAATTGEELNDRPIIGEFFIETIMNPMTDDGVAFDCYAYFYFDVV
jgi:uncharacterized membrane protein